MSYENLPEKYRPAYIRAGLTPLKADSQMESDEVKTQMKKQKVDPYAKKSAPIIFLKDGEDPPKIREGLTMQATEASMWYENDTPVPEDQVIDNNDFVDLEKIQIPAPACISSIRQKLLSKKQEQIKPDKKPMFAAPGEYVLFYNREIVEVGTLEKIKPLIEEIIINNEELTDDDLAVFLRVPLDKIFK
jgi:hypothetical protein